MICDPRFAPVQEALAENRRSRGEDGAAVCVIVDGEVVVDIWTGAWTQDTVVDVFSVGKAFAALCVLRLADRGVLSLDDALPGFASGVTVRQVLSHRSGLAALRHRGLSAYDRPAVVAALAAQEPWWPPGTAHGYHVHTFGYLCGAICQAFGDAAIEDVLRAEIADGLDVWFGCPAARRGDVARFIYGEEMRTAAAGFPDAAYDVLVGAANMLPTEATGLDTVDTPAWMDAVLPSSNTYATARGVASVYARLLSGALLSAALLQEATSEWSAGDDLVLMRPSRFGLGLQLTQPERPLGPSPRAFGHFGAGGALGFADPDAGLAAAYVMNAGGPRWQSPRNRAIVDAIYACV